MNTKSALPPRRPQKAPKVIQLGPEPDMTLTLTDSDKNKLAVGVFVGDTITINIPGVKGPVKCRVGAVNQGRRRVSLEVSQVVDFNLVTGEETKDGGPDDVA